MRNKLKEEKGYTIIIALLLIVLFLSASAVFVQASLSHAKQEQTIDRNNLAVVAAEMGSERYTKQTQIHLNETYAALLEKANLKKEEIVAAGKAYKTTTNYSGCPNVRSPQELMDCEFNLLEQELAADLQQSIQSYLAALNKNSVTVDTDVSYSLVRFELESAVSPDQEVNLLLEVRGEKGETGSKLLRSDLTFYNPFILDREKSTDIEIIVDTELKTVSNFFPQVVEKQLPECEEPVPNMEPCQLNENINTKYKILLYINSIKRDEMKSDFYIRINNWENTQLNSENMNGIPVYLTNNVKLDEPNINGTQNMFIYKQGTLNFKNLNARTTNNFVVAESLSFNHNQDIINNTFILTGSDSKPSFRPSSLKINSGSTLCINLDDVKLMDPGSDPRLDSDSNGIDINSFNTINRNGDNLVTDGTGEIYLYSENADPKNSTANIEHIKNPDEFMSKCGVRISYVPDDPIKYQVPGLTALEGMDMDWDVDYTP